MRLIRLLQTGTLGLGACILLAAIQSCASTAPQEQLIRSSIAGDDAPNWVGGTIAQTPGTVTFVGRGGGINVLDERHAFDEALGHARAQLAQYVATQVSTEDCLQDISSGARFLSLHRHFEGNGERVDQSIRSRVHELADVIVGGVAASEQHWEQWSVSNARPTGFMNVRSSGLHSFRRYKCWILAHVDQETIDRYVTATLNALENAENHDQEDGAAKATKAAVQATAMATARAAAAEADVQSAANALSAQSWELQRLRERVHYGRRFRLTSEEDCLHYRAPCDFDRLHPEWKAPEYLVRTEVAMVQVPVEVLVHAPAGCQFCSDTPCNNHH
jgi:hypothetical protein